MTGREYLELIMPTREMVDHFVTPAKADVPAELATKDVPVIDLRDAFREAYATYRGDVRVLLEPYYIGHHTPRGNFFFAWAIKDRVVEWLDPRPLPYR